MLHTQLWLVAFSRVCATNRGTQSLLLLTCVPRCIANLIIYFSSLHWPRENRLLQLYKFINNHIYTIRALPCSFFDGYKNRTDHATYHAIYTTCTMLLHTRHWSASSADSSRGPNYLCCPRTCIAPPPLLQCALAVLPPSGRSATHNSSTSILANKNTQLNLLNPSFNCVSN